MSSVAYKEEENVVYLFNSLDTIEGGAKLTKNGEVKKTHSNAKKGRSTWQDPIRSVDDLNKVLNYLQTRIDNEDRYDYKKARCRNKMYFCIGISSGFRVSDMLNICWGDIFTSNGEFKDNVIIKEEKTGKMKRLTLNTLAKDAIMQYVNMFHPNVTDDSLDNYIFVNRQNKKLGKHSVDDFIKDFSKACNLDGKFSTHSIRKTYAYQGYMALVEAGDKMAEPKICNYLNHSSLKCTARYLGLNKDEELVDVEILEKHLCIKQK